MVVLRHVRLRFGNLARQIWAPLGRPFAEAFARQAFPLGYSPSLDGWRALATMVVLGYHVRPLLLPGAMIVLDSFFLLSGYFITSLLLREYERSGSVRFGRFLVRRAARLLPAWAVLCVVILAVRAAWVGDVDLRQILLAVTVPFRLFWVDDFATGMSTVPAAMGHLWTITIELKYYVIWGALFLLLARLVGITWWLFAGSVSLAVLVWLVRTSMYWTGDFHRQVLISEVFTHSDALLIGDALAIAFRLLGDAPRPLFDKTLRVLLLPVLTASIIFLFTPNAYPLYFSGWSFLVGPLCSAYFLLALLRLRETLLHRFLEFPLLVIQGRIFYGLYLWSFPIFMMVDTFGFRHVYGGRAFIGIPLTYFAAIASFLLVERHFMRLRRQADSAGALAARAAA